MKYTEVPITQTLEQNFMPFAMSVIVARALPEIDGFKPAHRKLLYTMYKMGLLTGSRTKSANIVGQTMRLNPHGESAIYETMVRLTRANESLLVPFVDSKGNFGKVYSRDMSYAASRYTEAKLDKVCTEIFSEIDSDTVDFVPNYDGKASEPVLLPTTFPNILVSANLGIAVAMACNICGFDLNEVCRTTIELIKNPNHHVLSTLTAPDFATGGQLIFNPAQMEEIYKTGRGSFKLRAKWHYNKKDNIIEVTQIPYTTTIEAIIDKVSDLIKQGSVREIADMRDETGLNGLKIAIDLKRGADPDKLMAKLMRSTTLMDTFSCNFNILIAGTPRVMGVTEILTEWTSWRTDCVRRRLHSDLTKKKAKLHLLKGLKKILLDIDRAIAIIRETEEEGEVIPNLMIGFGIDETQAEYIAEIRLRNINKEYILKRIAETAELEGEIAKIEDILANRKKIEAIIIKELEGVIKKYPTTRRTEIVYESEITAEEEEEEVEDIPVHLFLTKEGYAKKIAPNSLRMSGEQKLKEGDIVAKSFETSTNSVLLVLTNKCQAYKLRVAELSESRASLLGDFLPAFLTMEEGEYPVFYMLPGDYKGNLIFVFQNGKVANIELSVYETKSNRRKLTNAFSDKSPLVAAFHITSDVEISLQSGGRMLIFSTLSLAPKTTRSSQGVAVMNVKKNSHVEKADLLDTSIVTNPARYRTRTLPAAGAIIKNEDSEQKQLTLTPEEV